MSEIGRMERAPHDPLCYRYGQDEKAWIICECGTIGRARADERARIAQAIEALRDQFIRVAHADADSIIVKVYDDAVRIARNGGSDE